MMEDRYSVNSPRRILSFSKRRRATVSFLDQDDRTYSGFGPKTSEVYGFVGSITTVVATGLSSSPYFYFFKIIFLIHSYQTLIQFTYMYCICRFAAALFIHVQK